MSKLAAGISDATGPENTATYYSWLKHRLRKSINSNKPRIPHSDVIIGAQKIIDDIKAKRKLD